MEGKVDHYKVFRDFVDKYLPDGFQNISWNDPFIIAMEEQLSHYNQFFYIADLMKVAILFTSAGSERIIGLPPAQVDTATFFTLAHTEDQERLNRAQAKLYSLGQELFINEKGISIVSAGIRERGPSGKYIDLLLQTYSFFSAIPEKTVYTMIVATQLASYKQNGQGYHYYAGNNPGMFRYPDEALLNEGHFLSARELDILKLVADGLGSEQIANKLLLSVNTVNTHRRNMLKKANKSTTQDLVVELKERGLL